MENRLERRIISLKFNNKKAEEILKMRLNGYSLKELATIFNVSHECIRERTIEIATKEEKEKIKNYGQLIKSWSRFTKNEEGIKLSYGKWHLTRRRKTLYKHKNKEKVIEFKKKYIKKYNFKTG
jgi:hypothetical protein